MEAKAASLDAVGWMLIGIKVSDLGGIFPSPCIPRECFPGRREISMGEGNLMVSSETIKD
jgi:hypothetical protein